VKASHPDFLFLAEAYWNTEPELLALGFDYTYDKGFYDALLAGHLDGMRQMLWRPAALQSRMVHFVENHDETRAVVAFGAQRSLAAAAISLLIPGARLVYEGQLSGWRVKAPVQLARIPDEPTDLEVEPFYRTLLGEARQTIYRAGVFTPLNGAPGTVVAFAWTLEQDWRLIVVNYADQPTHVTLALPGGLLPTSLAAAQEVFTNTNVLLSTGGQSNLTFDLDLPAFGVRIWRPR
jgi:hypothetical protein